jgi:hypothetical protein
MVSARNALGRPHDQDDADYDLSYLLSVGGLKSLPIGGGEIIALDQER